MGMFKTFLTVIVCAAISIGVYGFLAQRNNAAHSPVVNTNANIPMGWKIAKNSSSDTFAYPETLGTKYIATVGWAWPPATQGGLNSNSGYQNFRCDDSVPIVEGESASDFYDPKQINGRSYCVAHDTEGAAGSIYHNYSYIWLGSDRNVTVTFALQYPQCANYNEPQRSECKVEENSFDVDNLADQIAQTLIVH